MLIDNLLVFINKKDQIHGFFFIFNYPTNFISLTQTKIILVAIQLLYTHIILRIISTLKYLKEILYLEK